MLTLQGSTDESGTMKLFNRAALTDWLNKHPNKQVVLTIKVNHKRRSNPQNGYYWAVVVQMVMDAMNAYGNDFTPDEIHETLKAKFNFREVETMPDNFTEVPVSTARLNTVEFSQYIEKIQRYAAVMLNINIPSPNEQMTIDFK